MSCIPSALNGVTPALKESRGSDVGRAFSLPRVVLYDPAI